ncbi:chemotaxis protein CheV [Glaciecola sp. 1036]|uniref:chemotaxis protein CheV n=1 Tax=Alteromonadaceae TaxID=72275 RepID=UPI003D07B963
MSNILSSVDSRTKLVGENRLELLLFKLGTRHTFALNVFKIREVITLPKMNQIPGAHHNIKGVINARGKSIPVIDLRSAIKLPFCEDEYEGTNVIITEYNRSVQGFLIGQIVKIINTSWNEIQPPPKSAGKNHFLTAITRVKDEKKDELVEIIDVEKVLADIIDYDVQVSQELLQHEVSDHLAGKKVLIVDDSPVARQQIQNTLSQLGIEIIERQNGQEALNLLKSWADQGKKVTDEILMLYTDAEMPEMDGYRLTAEIRQDPRMNDLFITLNTSLSGNFNQAMVEKVGCDRFISKFQPNALVEVALERMEQVLEAIKTSQN